MEQKYKVLRLNTAENTITVLLYIGEKTLQEDVQVDNFTDMVMIEQKIGERLAKFSEDLTRAAVSENVEVNPALQALVDVHIKSFKEAQN